MNHLIKEFLENNITFVEHEDWKTFFENWYSCSNYIYAEELWDQLVSVFEVAEIDILSDTEEIRKNILLDNASQFISRHSSSKLSKTIVFNNLRSLLGVYPKEISKIIDAAAKLNNLVSFNGFYYSK